MMLMLSVCLPVCLCVYAAPWQYNDAHDVALSVCLSVYLCSTPGSIMMLMMSVCLSVCLCVYAAPLAV